MDNVLNEIVEKLYGGDDSAVAELTQDAITAGINAAEVLNEGLLAGMDRVGVDFRDDKLFVPEVLIAARAMHAGMEVLRPLLADGDITLAGKVVIGTVEGDLHDIGKNLVAMMLEGGGFEIIDIGTDVPADGFIEAVRKEEPDVVGMSALLTTTMQSMKYTIDALENAGLRKHIKIIVGGAPVTQDFANEIGADGFAPDAGSAVECVRALIG